MVAAQSRHLRRNAGNDQSPPQKNKAETSDSLGMTLTIVGMSVGVRLHGRGGYARIIDACYDKGGSDSLN